jgi:hypothetical protein
VILGVAASLLPFWTFPYVPTQDGPSHLANALILKDYSQPESRFPEFYWINWNPIPNWSGYILLAGLSYLFPPLIAEKLLVTLYSFGFAFTFQYFVGALREPSPWLTLAGFLLAFGSCFWLGFYNYCLSLLFLFVILGYLLRRWNALEGRHVVVLGLLFFGSFLTHLVGFVLAAASCFWIAATLLPRRWQNSVWLIAATLLPAGLALKFLYEARIAGPAGLGKLYGYLEGWLVGDSQWERITQGVMSVKKELLGINVPGLSGLLLISMTCLYACFLAGGYWNKRTGDQAVQHALRRSLVGLSVVLGLLYFILPEGMTRGMGGYLKTRLVLLPPLLWLACSQQPVQARGRYFLGIATSALLALTTYHHVSFMQCANNDLAEFTAGLDVAGRGRVLFLDNKRKASAWVDPLFHAGDYYCLGSKNINTADHFAKTLHSVVRLQAGIEEGWNYFQDYPNRSLIDTIIVWNDVGHVIKEPEGFRIKFNKGRLTIMKRE